MSKFYPIFLNLEKKDILIVGAGNVAERKAKFLLEFGANISIIGKHISAGLKKLLKEKRVKFLGENFLPEYLKNQLMVIVATDNMRFNQKIASLVKKKGILVNVVDQPLECDFIMPSIVKRGDLLIAISTSGKSPILSKLIRKELEKKYGYEYKIFLDILSAIRKAIIKFDCDNDIKEKILTNLIYSDLLDKIKQKDLKGILNTVNLVLSFLKYG